MPGSPACRADAPTTGAFAGWDFESCMGAYVSFAGALVFFVGLAYAFARRVQAPPHLCNAAAHHMKQAAANRSRINDLLAAIERSRRP
jgi:hypothetical protein